MDVWLGSRDAKILTGILCTFDTLKRDAEIKLLLGCSAQDVELIISTSRFAPLDWQIRRDFCRFGNLQKRFVIY